MMDSPNVVQVAIAAAGGRKKACERLGLPEWTLSRWQANRAVPSDQVRALCDLTGGIVTVEMLLAFIEESKAKRARV